MSSFLFNPIGTAGDVYPHVAIASELQKRGHRVRLMATPNNEPLAIGEGLDFIPIGEPLGVNDLAQDPRLRRPYSAWKAAMQWAALGMMESVYEQILALSTAEPLTVVAPVWSLGARMARETSSIRLVQLMMNPCLLRSAERPPLLPMLPMPTWTPRWFKRWQYRIADRTVLDPILTPGLNRYRAKLGLSPVRRVMDRWWYSPDPVLGLFSDKFAPKPSDWPTPIELLGHTLWDPDGEENEVRQALEFVKSNAGAIAVIPGSAGPCNPQLIPILRKACCSIGCPMLLLSPLNCPDYGHSLLNAEYEKFHHCRYAPLAKILPHCALIIHSACIGATCQALAAGIPHICMPSVNDQFDNARRLLRLNVSTTINPHRTSEQEVTRMIRQALTDYTVLEQCHQLRSKHRQSSVPLVANRLEAISGEVASPFAFLAKFGK